MRRAVAIALLAGCVDANAPELLPRGDLADYQARVHPIVEEKCGTLDCHGHPGRPLRIYSETGLRMSDDRDAGITPAELAANVASLTGVDPAPATLDEALVLSKPLAGGVHHVGGAEFASADDPDYQILRDWLGRALGFIP